MNPIRSVLVPIDFSDASKHALNYGLHFAREFGAALRLIHVVDWALSARYTQFIPAVEDEVREVRKTEKALDALIPDSFRGSVECRVEAVTGNTVDVLLQKAEREPIDLVVMGSHGRRGFKRWFMGSVTEHALRRMPVPVMTVSQVDEAVEPVPDAPLEFKRILYPTDFSDSKEVALPVALEFAERWGAELELVHVVERLHRSPTSPPWTDEELEQERHDLIERATTTLESLVPASQAENVKLRRTVLEGRAAHAILEYAAENPPDLIVITLHGMSFIERALLGATAERVVRAAHAPVLAIPPATNHG